MLDEYTLDQFMTRRSELVVLLGAFRQQGRRRQRPRRSGIESASLGVDLGVQRGGDPVSVATVRLDNSVEIPCTALAGIPYNGACGE